MCEDGASTHTVVHSDADHIRTCHLYVQEVVMEDEWGEPASSDAVKSYKVVDIRDVTVAFKPPQPSPVKEGSTDGTGRPEEAGIKRSHSQEPAVGNNHSTGATEPKKPKLDGAAKSGKGGNETILTLLLLKIQKGNFANLVWQLRSQFVSYRTTEVFLNKFVCNFFFCLTGCYLHKV